MKHVAPSADPLEPVRLIAGGGTAHERRLLEAASFDVMPAGTPERLEQALSAWAALPGARASEAAPAARGARRIRWGITGGLGGLAIVGWLLARGSAPIAREIFAPTAVVPFAPVAVVSSPGVQPTPLLGAPDRVAPALEETPSGRTSGAPSHAPRPSARSSGATRSGRTDRAGSRGNLLEEARRLDAVRAALDAADGPAARRELLEYRARFARGELALEADVLEADLLLFAGKPERARVLANALLERPDAGRYRQRLDQLLHRARTAEQRASQGRASASAGSNRTPANMETER